MSSSLVRSGASIICNNRYSGYDVDLSSNRRQRDYDTYSRDSFKEVFNLKSNDAYVNEANQIMRERLKNRGNSINSKGRMKSVVLRETKEICLKNYLIGLLKTKRTDINEKERKITKALSESEKQLDADYQGFIRFVERTKEEQKKEEMKLTNLKNEKEQKEKILKEEISQNKKRVEELEKTIKNIYVLKSYGSFVHKVLEMPFVFDDIKEIECRERNFEYIADKILQKYDEFQEYAKPSLMDDQSILFIKFKEFEDKVIKVLETKNTLNKENKALQKNDQAILNELMLRQEEFKDEEKLLIYEYNQALTEQKNLQFQKLSETEKFLNYIIELGIATGKLKDKFKGKRNINECLVFTKDTLDALQEKEILINKYIREIEDIESKGNKKVMQEIQFDTKNRNKKEKQRVLKEKQEQLENLKKKKAIERAERVVIKGRIVPKEYPIFKEKKQKKKITKDEGKSDYGLLYYSSDEN